MGFTTITPVLGVADHEARSSWSPTRVPSGQFRLAELTDKSGKTVTFAASQ
jgi:hypothetical protein